MGRVMVKKSYACRGAVGELCHAMSATEPNIETEVEVMFFDTDCGGVVSNISYLRFIETARTHLTSHMGMSPQEMSESQLFPAVTRSEIDYRRPARLGDRLTVTAAVERLEKIRIHCRFEILRKTDDTLISTARQVLALVQLPQGRPQRVPDSWFERWPGLSDVAE